MGLSSDNLPPFLKQGEVARLIPSGSESSKERRTTSVLLASFMGVEEFGKQMLGIVGAPNSKRARISAYSEVVFNHSKDQRDLRPDGLIQVDLGSRSWSALIEAKVGNAELNAEQIEAYLDIARDNKLNAVITISNQFAPLPTHHPVKVNGHKTRSVALYHWSWMSIASEATLLLHNTRVDDPDRAFLLTEVLRYLEDAGSGVSFATRMGAGWRDVCTAIQHDTPISKNGDDIHSAVSDWHQLLRYMSLQMSQMIGHNVTVAMARKHASDPALRLQDAITDLANTHRLEAEFDIPHAASRLKLVVDVNRRTLAASMRLKAPTDRSRPSALATWALNQVKRCDLDQLMIRASWPGRVPDTSCTLAQLREGKAAILSDTKSVLPNAFEFSIIQDVAARIKGANTFVDEVEQLLPRFYEEVGQHLVAWVQPAPKIQSSDEGDADSVEA